MPRGCGQAPFFRKGGRGEKECFKEFARRPACGSRPDAHAINGPAASARPTDMGEAGSRLTVYDLLIAGVALLGGILCADGQTTRRRDAALLMVSFAVLGTLSAFRYDIGIDYSYIYAPAYERVLADPVGFGFSDTRFEPGFALLEKAIALLFENYQMLFIVTGYLTIGLFMLCYRRQSPHAVVSILLFLMLSEYYCSMNFIRQTLAGVIALLGLPFLKQRRFLPFLSTVLLAAAFHKSALILIPVFFLCMVPFNQYVLAGYCIVTALVYFNTESIMAFVTRFWYQGYSARSIHFQVGFEWPFTIAMLVEFLIVLLGAKRIRTGDPGNNVYLHYAFLAFFFTLMGTRHSILDRLSLYFELAFPLSIPLVYLQFRRDFSGWREALRGRDRLRRRSAATALGLLAVILGGGLGIHRYALTMDHHGVVPYRMVWNQPFYAEYLSELRMPRLEVNSGLQEYAQQPEEIPEDFAQTAAQAPPVTPPEQPASDAPSPSEGEPGAPAELTLEEFLALDGGK